MDILAAYRQSLTLERDALSAFIARTDAAILPAIDLLHGCRGRVAVVGMGKCGYVGRKLAATFSSTGTPAVYVHPAEALHGDLGFIGPDDVALILSNSGETSEICELLPHLKRRQLRAIAMTGRPGSTLGQYSDVVIDTSVAREADPIGMAPTASTTLMLAAGDALAAVLMARRGFTKEHYAACHPGGSLGQKLLCRVEELMHGGKDLPVVAEDVPLRDAIFEITSKRLGMTLVTNDRGGLAGIITDGDLRRIFQREPDALALPVRGLMTRNPRRIMRSALAVEALRFMEDCLITSLAVMENGDSDRAVGVLHIHDLVRAGIQ